MSVSLPVQKFHRGDLVKIADTLPSSMSHFTGRGCYAFVIGSYHDICTVHDDPEDPNTTDYSLMVIPKDDRPHCSSWYPESTLSLVEERYAQNAGFVSY